MDTYSGVPARSSNMRRRLYTKALVPSEGVTMSEYGYGDGTMS